MKKVFLFLQVGSAVLVATGIYLVGLDIVNQDYGKAFMAALLTLINTWNFISFKNLRRDLV